MAALEVSTGYELDWDAETGEVTVEIVDAVTRQEQADESFDGESSHPGARPGTLVRGFFV